MRAPLLVLLWVVGFGSVVRGWAGEWVSGPMLGYQTHREVAIWMETRGAGSVALTYHVKGQPGTARTLVKAHPATTPAGVQPITFVLPLLEMGAEYTYAIAIDGQPLEFPYPLTFETTDQWEWRRPAPDFSFLFGTCAYLNDPPYDRPGDPYGKGTQIFRNMAATQADFMVWGGDNLYLREADFSSRSGIWYRYSHDRAVPDLQPLWAAMPHYATWDDHDYGPNDSNRTFEFKDTSLAAFQTYWANPSWGEPDNPGVYGKFTWGDAMFLLLDDRYHRDESTLDQNQVERKSVWGAQQFEWLKQSLLHAKELGHYRFKFIVTGGQFLQSIDTAGHSETHELYRHEREALIEFIRANAIHGVVFLTGDVHFSGLYRRQIGPTQFLYEITSSPLSSGSWDPTALRGGDPALVPGTLVGTQNFCHVFVRGPQDARELLVRCVDRDNVLRWEHIIRQSELE